MNSFELITPLNPYNRTWYTNSIGATIFEELLYDLILSFPEVAAYE